MGSCCPRSENPDLGHPAFGVVGRIGCCFPPFRQKVERMGHGGFCGTADGWRAIERRAGSVVAASAMRGGDSSPRVKLTFGWVGKDQFALDGSLAAALPDYILRERNRCCPRCRRRPKPEVEAREREGNRRGCRDDLRGFGTMAPSRQLKCRVPLAEAARSRSVLAGKRRPAVGIDGSAQPALPDQLADGLGAEDREVKPQACRRACRRRPRPVQMRPTHRCGRREDRHQGQ